MGTAVLLPHDCMPNSKNRSKGHLSEAIFYSDRGSRSRRGTSQASEFRDLDSTRKNTPIGRVGSTAKFTSLPLSDHGSDPLQKVEGRKFKVRRPTEVRESTAKSDFDVHAFTILQRPKNKEAADELFVKFLVKVKGEKMSKGQLASKSEFSVTVDDSNKPKHQASVHTKLPEMQLPRSKLKKGGCMIEAEDPTVVDLNLSVPKIAEKVEGYKLEEDLIAIKGQCHNVALGVAEPLNAKRLSDHGFRGAMHLKGLSQVTSLKVAAEQKHLRKVGLVESLKSKQLYPKQPESTGPGGLPRLKRATTDPQFVKQLVGRGRSEVVDIPLSEGKSCNGFTKMASMSCPERWAGPSYFSSPAPSSLPLPKFSAPNQKLPSFQSTGEGHTRNIPQLPDLESPSAQGAGLDVAFATRSLRRMLKLDPF